MTSQRYLLNEGKGKENGKISTKRSKKYTSTQRFS